MELVYKYYFLKWLLENTEDKELKELIEKSINEIEQGVSKAYERLYE